MNIINEITGLSMTVILILAVTTDYFVSLGMRAKYKVITSNKMAQGFLIKLFLAFFPAIMEFMIRTLDYYVSTFTPQDMTVSHWGMLLFTIVLLIQEFVSIKGYLKLTNPEVIDILDRGAKSLLPQEVVNKAEKLGILSKETEKKNEQ
ncbi:hypothetical protein [Lactococcus allomyrinae]|uniref:Holin n=1 Tax=Lactococcus allomyrinae TaxID=2419773 RepID=A0A387BGG6_9LACT|nr:hypothetical protein [Lactococcus allomyrinae]AYG01718.1 hypothetical protein D7I46_12025 [Lactococcus allomyrinae]